MDFETFKQMAHSLERLTAHLSLSNQVRKFPAYRNLLAAGESVRPFIIDMLRDGDRWPVWFMLLRELTPDMNPVSKEDKGNLEKMAQAWIRLAEVKGWKRKSC